MNNFLSVVLSLSVYIIINLLTLPSFAAIYYIKNGGNDKASGLSDTKAWRTIAKVNDFAENPGFSDGDVIQFKRGDTWSNDETLGFDGSVIKWGGVNGLTFQDYSTGAKPRLNANTQQPIYIATSSISNVTIKNLDCSGMDYVGVSRSHIQLSYFSGLAIEGIKIDGHLGAKAYNRHFAFIRLYNIDGDIEIKNCILQNAVKKSWGDTVNGWGKNDVNLISIKYDDNDVPKTTGKVVITGNILHDVYADCILLNSIRSEIYIHSNSLYNFGENAIDLKSVKNCDIYDNKMSRGGYGMGGSGGGKSNIVTHSSAQTSAGLDLEDIIIRNNEFYDSNYYGIRLLGICRNTEIYGNVFTSVYTPLYVSSSPGTRIHDNKFLGNKYYGAEGVNASAIYITNTSQNDIEIYNNSIFSKSNNYRFGIYFTPREGRTGIEITNNIIQISQNSNSAYPLMVEKRAGDYPKVTDNCFYNSNHKNRVRWKGTSYDTTNLTDWRKVNNSKGIFGNPLFRDPENGDLRLRNNSPCIGWGADPITVRSDGVPPPSSLQILN